MSLAKKHICIDARLIHATGIGRYLRDLIQGLERLDRYKLSILCAKKDAGDFVHPIICKSCHFTLREQLELPLKIPDCDLFFSSHFNIPLLPIRAKKRVTTLFDAYHLDHAKTLNLLKKVYAKLFFHSVFKQAKSVITISSFSKERLMLHCKPNKEPTLIYPGIDLTRFQTPPDREKQERVRNKYKLPERFLLTLCNFKPHKNIRRLIAAYFLYHAQEEHPLPLVLCGNLKGLKKIEKALLHPSLSLPGFIDEEDLPTLYHLADLFLFPSLYEGFGYPPLEAMAALCPTIVARAGSLPEVCGEASVFVDPLSIHGMGRAIREVLSNRDLQKSCKEKGKERVALFSHVKSQDLHLKLIDEVLQCE